MSRLRERWRSSGSSQRRPLTSVFVEYSSSARSLRCTCRRISSPGLKSHPSSGNRLGSSDVFTCQCYPAPLLAVIQALWKVTLGLSCIGLFTRFSTVTSFILGVYLLGLPYNFGLLSHSNAILVFVLGIMALSRCGDSCSVDQLLRTARRRASHR